MRRFTLEHTDSSTRARAGVYQTAHGPIRTPIFMPVGTVASVKGVHQRELREDIDPAIILG
ncbi:MAG: tRNA guanosine(34) transglycosylase Tgt, partial [Robiginitalea sp.]